MNKQNFTTGNIFLMCYRIICTVSNLITAHAGITLSDVINSCGFETLQFGM
jgi:hypothetical protein